MRIGFNFHTADEYISGVEHYSLGLLNSLLSVDDKNQYIVFTNQPALVKRRVAAKDNLTVKDLSFLRTRAQRILWEHLRLPAAVRKESLDILHCPHYICPVFKSDVPYVITIHDTIAIDHPDWCKTANAVYYNIFMKHTTARAAKVIAVSKCTAENINRRLKIEESRITVIHPGIDSCFNGEADLSRQQRIRLKYCLPEKYILFVSNIEPKKNIVNLLRAFELLKQKRLPHRLVIVGKRTWKSKDIWNHIRSSFDPENITITGYADREDLPSVYKMADVFVFASLCEGFGFPALEAMACGTAVAASSTGILKEIDSRAYRCVKPSDPWQIAKTVYSLITDNEWRHRQIEIARRESSKFSWLNCVKKTLSVYKEVIKSYE